MIPLTMEIIIILELYFDIKYLTKWEIVNFGIVYNYTHTSNYNINVFYVSYKRYPRSNLI